MQESPLSIYLPATASFIDVDVYIPFCIIHAAKYQLPSASVRCSNAFAPFTSLKAVSGVSPQSQSS